MKLVMALVAVAVSAPAIAQSNDLQLVQAHLRAVTSMTANFTQIDRKGGRVTGTLMLQRPGRIRFEYQKGVPILIVGDGRALNFIDYQVRQVSRWPIGKSPLAALLDPSQDLSRYGKIVPSGDPRILLAEARDPKRPQFGAITLAFARDAAAPAGLRLQGWVALDAQRNRTTVTLSNQRFNVAVPADAFKFRDPRGSGPRR